MFVSVTWSGLRPVRVKIKSPALFTNGAADENKINTNGPSVLHSNNNPHDDNQTM